MLSIVIPAYNNPQLLREGLMSLVLQNYKKFITIVVDDCSPTDLMPVIEEFKPQLMKLIYIKKEKNEGVGLARQTGIDWAYEHGCDYIMFMDQDDLLYPNAAQELYKTAKAKMCEMVVSPIVQEDLKHESQGYIDKFNWLWFHGKIYSLHFLHKYNIRFSKKIKYNEDGHFNMLTKNFVEKITRIDTPLYRWRDNPLSLTRNKEQEFHRVICYNALVGFLEAQKTLIENNKLNDVAEMISIIYNYYEKFLLENQKYRNRSVEDFNEIHQYITEFLQQPIVIQKMNSAYTKKEIARRIQCIDRTITNDGPIQMFPHNFYQWLDLFQGGSQIKEVLSQ